MKALVPKDVLGNKALIQRLSALSMTVLREVDRLAGASNVMRIEAAKVAERDSV